MHLLICRPGALGDVLLLRPCLKLLRAHARDCRVTLLAPGERGRLLLDSCDHLLNLDRADCAWLYGGNGPCLPALEPLRGATAALCFQEPVDGMSEAFSALDVGLVAFHPANPAADSARHASLHLWEGLRAVCAFPAIELMDCDQVAPIRTEEAWEAVKDQLDLHEPFAVLHPGSGSARKNAPLELFAEQGARWISQGMSVYITAGEADGELGTCLERLLPEARLLPPLSLQELAGVLGRASGYLGNDSGVSHLAAQCAAPTTALFQTTDPTLWRPVGRNVTVELVSTVQ